MQIGVKHGGTEGTEGRKRGWKMEDGGSKSGDGGRCPPYSVREFEEMLALLR